MQVEDKYLAKYLHRTYAQREEAVREDIEDYKEASRLAKLNMEPYSSLKNKITKNIHEKEMILMKILDQIKAFKVSEQTLEQKSRELGNYLISNCEGCKERYEHNCREHGEKKLTWNKYFATNYYDFCNPDSNYCKNAAITWDDEKCDVLQKIIDERLFILAEHKNLEISYKVALEQQINLVELYKTLISRYRENNAILIFKKNHIQRKINYIQLSVIFVSAVITLFETIKPTLLAHMSSSLLMVFPIALSTYIGLILAVGRFFKFDTKNEQIIKLIEKYSFIINKFVQKKDRAANYDFKFKNVEKWDELLELEEKDNITDIILKASEERDIVLTPKEHIYYKKKYTKVYLKELMESMNLKNLSYLVSNADNQNQEINTFVQNIIVKESFLRYYCCCLWCYKKREYVDYDKVMLKDVVHFDKERIALNKKREKKLENEVDIREVKEKIEKYKTEIDRIRKKREKKIQKKNNKLNSLKSLKEDLYEHQIRKQPIINNENIETVMGNLLKSIEKTEEKNNDEKEENIKIEIVDNLENEKVEEEPQNEENKNDTT